LYKKRPQLISFFDEDKESGLMAGLWAVKILKK
jgi:hypothetical protein